MTRVGRALVFLDSILKDSTCINISVGVIYKRLKLKTEGSNILSHSVSNGVKGYQRRGTRRKDERFESVRG
jgi:hypothetical protein